MDRLQRVVAYDFFVRQGKRNIAAGKQQEFDRLMLSTLQNMDIFRLLAFRRAFVHISIDTLDDPMLSNMPASSVIFVLEPSQTGSVSDEMLQQLDTLKQRGMRFALEPAAYDPGDLPAHLQNDLFSRMDFMVLDFAAPSSKVLAPILDQLPKRYPTVRWMARNVGTAEDLDVCLRGPGHHRFALFHGPFIATVRALEGGKVDASQTRVLQIMRMLRANAEAAEIEIQFKLDSVLLFAAALHEFPGAWFVAQGADHRGNPDAAGARDLVQVAVHAVVHLAQGRWHRGVAAGKVLDPRAPAGAHGQLSR